MNFKSVCVGEDGDKQNTNQKTIQEHYNKRQENFNRKEAKENLLNHEKEEKNLDLKHSTRQEKQTASGSNRMEPLS